MTYTRDDMQRRKFLAGAGLVAGVAATPVSAQAPAQFRWKLQSGNPAGTPHMTLLNKFASNVDKMSNGRLKIEVLTSGAIVNPFEILDAVNKGVVDSGQWWTHYATGKHPAGGLFSAPLGGSGSGLDQMGQLGWYFRGGGRELYIEYYTKIMKADVMPFLYAPDGPESASKIRQWFLDAARGVPTIWSQSRDGPAPSTLEVKISMVSPDDSLESSGTSRPLTRAPMQAWQIGRASCRERVL